MSDDFEPQDELMRRLRALGQYPVDSAAQSRHLTAMAEAAAAPSLFGTLGNRLRVAAALVVGFMLGTTGLASAGALGPLQPIAATAIEAVTPFNVPHPDDAGTARYRGEECDDNVSYKNRGSYLKAIREEYGKDSAQLTAAKASKCGMPIASDGDDADATDDSTENKGNSSDAKENKGKSDDAKENQADKAKGPKDVSEEGAGEAGTAQATCANGAAGNGVEPADGAAVAAGEEKPSEEAPPTPTTGAPSCSAAGDAGATGADASDAADANGKKPADPGKSAGAGNPDGEQDETTPAPVAPEES